MTSQHYYPTVHIAILQRVTYINSFRHTSLTLDLIKEFRKIITLCKIIQM